MLAKVLIQTLVVLVLLAALLFGLAGTVYWFGAQVLLAAFGIGGLIMSLWLVRKDRGLLNERMNPKRQKKELFDRIILPLQNLFVFGWIAWMALTVRWYGEPRGMASISIAAGAVIVACFLLVVWVLRENTFATALVRAQPERGHKVIDTGPYAVVRHPMYSAAVIAYLAIPLTLGLMACVWAAPIPILCLSVRILFEEKLLRRELTGYGGYMEKVRYRLIPFIW